MSPKVAVHGQRKKEDTRAIVPVCAMPFDNFLSTGTCIAPRHCHDIIISQKPKLCKFFAIKIGQIFLKIKPLAIFTAITNIVFFFLCFPKALKSYFKHLCVCRTFVLLLSLVILPNVYQKQWRDYGKGQSSRWLTANIK